MVKYPLYTIFNEGLGYQYSLATEGSLIPGKTLGNGRVGIYANLANGNLAISDYPLSVREAVGDIPLHFNFNLQATSPKTAWRFSQDKRIKQFPSPGKPAILIEGDGRVVELPQYKDTGYNLSPGDATGRWILHDGLDEWSLYHTGSRTYEFYNNKGLRTRLVTKNGASLHFEYCDGQLSKITAQPSGNVYALERSDHTLTLKLTENGKTTTLIRYTLDAYQRLTKTTIPNPDSPKNPYIITYEGYTPGSIWFNKINQSDGSSVCFVPAFNGRKNAIAGMSYNQAQYEIGFKRSSTLKRWLTGEDVKLGINAALLDPYGIYNKFKLDHQGQPVLYKQSQGYMSQSPDFDLTTYSYNDASQIDATSTPNKATIHESYDPYFAIPTKRVEGNGQTQEWLYAEGTRGIVICHYRYAGDPAKTKPVITRYTYQLTDKNDPSPLRFIISPEGRVTEFVPDPRTGLPAKKRLYINIKALFPVENFTPNSAPTLATMLDWIDELKKGNLAQVSLIDYERNERGQITKETTYTQVDPQTGEGIMTIDTGVTHYKHDKYDNETEKAILQYKYDNETEKAILQLRSTAGPIIATRHWSFDSIQRKTAYENPLKQATSTVYTTDKGITTITQTLPNGRVEARQISENAGLLQQVATVEKKGVKQQRKTTNKLDSLSRPLVTTHPDGQKTIEFYDRQQRLGFKVSAMGIVTGYVYDRKHNTVTTTRYAKPVDVNKLYNPLGSDNGPYEILLEIQLKVQQGRFEAKQQLRYQQGKEAKPNPNRRSYLIRDDSDRLRYEIDAEGYVIEHRYDGRDLETVTIEYHDELTSEELTTLLSGGTLTRKIDVTQDRVKHKFYDDDGLLIGTQDAAGFVTQLIRNGAGWTTERIRYATKTPLKLDSLNLKDVIPDPPNPLEDAKTSYGYNNRGLRTYKVDPEGYVTSYGYLPNGKRQYKRKYAIRLTPKQCNVARYSGAIIDPPKNSEDQITRYEYDLLERLIRVHKPFKCCDFTVYDDMGKVISQGSYDELYRNSTSPDCQRHTESMFDDWSQKINAINPWVGQALKLIDANPNLNKKEKKAEREKVIASLSMRNSYDETSGLLLMSEDSRGLKTWYFYDIDRRPFLTITSEGVITEHTLNAFDQVKKQRVYAKRFPEKDRPHLQGGFLSDVLREQLITLESKIKADAIDKYEFDNRGLTTKHTDADNYVFTATYNAFKEVDTETKSIDKNKAPLVIQHEYEPRGLETAVHRTVMDEKGNTTTLTDRYKYENLYGQKTLHVDADKQPHKTSYERRGLVRQRINVDLDLVEEDLAHDAFKRVEQRKNGLGEITYYRFNQAERSKTTVHSIAGTEVTSFGNVFKEEIERRRTDAHGDVIQESWQHTPDGQVAADSDALGNTALNYFDFEGDLIDTLDRSGVEDAYQRTPDGYVQQKVEDVHDEPWITDYKQNTFGDDVRMVGPERIVALPSLDSEQPFDITLTKKRVTTEQQFDKRHHCQTQVIDPTDKNPYGLALTTEATYNGLGHKTFEHKSASTDAAVSSVTHLIDGFNRDVGMVIDESDVALSEHLKRNGRGFITVTIDGNSNQVREYYDAADNKRFKITAKGGVIEWRYDKANRLIFIREYDYFIPKSNLSTLTDLAKVIDCLSGKTSPQDTMTWYYRDEMGRKAFKVNSQGEVCQWIYNGASKKIEKRFFKVVYSKELKELWQLRTEKLRDWLTNTIKPSQIIPTYYVRDAKQQVRFTIDSNCQIVEYEWDAKSRCIHEIKYDAKIKNLQQFVKLRLVQQIKLVNTLANPKKDRHSYRVYNGKGQERLSVDGDGRVIGRLWTPGHDETQLCRYKTRVEVPYPGGYDALKAALIDWVPDASVDRITSQYWDAGERRRRVVDGNGNQDDYLPNAVGNMALHRDREGNIWGFGHDGANRKTEDIAPLDAVTTTTFSTDTKKIKRELTTLGVMNKTGYDGASNITDVIHGINGPDPRALHIVYNGCNEPVITEQKEVPINNPAAPGCYTKPPVTHELVRSMSVYNGKRQRVVEINEAGKPYFSVFDNANQEVFRINPIGVVMGKTYVNGQIVSVRHYTNRLTLDLSPYVTTGLPFTLVKAHVKASPTDKTITLERDGVGRIIAIKRGPEYYYIPSADGKGSILTQDHAITRWTYNAFGDKLLKSSLVDGHGNVWANTWTFVDRTGKVLAQVDPNLHAERRWHDGFGDVVSQREFVDALKSSPNVDMDIEALDALLADIKSDDDHQFSFACDALGQRISKCLQKETVQRAVFNPTTHLPGMENDPELKDIVEQYLYSKTQHSRGTKVTIRNHDDPNDPKAKSYWKHLRWLNRRGLTAAQTEIPRQTETLKGKRVILVPLTLYGVNAHGEEVAEVFFYEGTSLPDPDVFPQPLQTSSHDQFRSKVYDNRGTLAYRQNGNGVVFGFTVTALKSQARKYYENANPDKKQGAGMTSVVTMDEVRVDFNDLNQAIKHSAWRDGIEDVTLAVYDAFNVLGEKVASGPDGKHWPFFWKYDALGYVWLSNAEKRDGTTRLTLRNLAGHVTGRMVSATKDLSAALTNPSALAKVLQWSYKDLQCIRLGRDLVGRMLFYSDYTRLIKGVLSRPTEFYQYNAFAKTRYINPLSLPTDYRYNHRVQRVKTTLPPITTSDAHGKSHVNQRYVLKHGYDGLGHDVGFTDAKGATFLMFINEAGQERMRMLGDGTIALRQLFDALGRVPYYFLAISRNNHYQQIFDKENNVIVANVPFHPKASSRATLRYKYNALNLRIYWANTANIPFWVGYGVLGHVRVTIDSMNHTTRFYAQLHPNGLLTRWQKNANGVYKWWDINAYGQLTENPLLKRAPHNDLGGAGYYQNYDFAGQVTGVQSVGGDHGNMVSVIKGLYLPKVSVTPAKHQTYVHVAGKLRQLIDYGLGRTMFYDYDVAGNRNYVKIVSFTDPSGYIYEATSVFNALGWEVGIIGNGFKAYIGYDPNGNRRFITVVLYDAANKPTAIKSYWFDYDLANRVTKANCNLLNGEIVPTLPESLVLTYVNSLRATQTRQGVTMNITYHPDGLYYQALTGTRPGTQTGSSVQYDAASRKLLYQALEKGKVVYGTWFYYYSDDVPSKTLTQFLASDTLDYVTDYADPNAMNLVTTQQTHYRQSNPKRLVVLDNKYVGFEAYHLYKISGTSYDPKSRSVIPAIRYPDANGFVSGQYNEGNIMALVASSEGWVLEQQVLTVKPPPWFGYNAAVYRFVLTSRGEPLGRFLTYNSNYFPMNPFDINYQQQGNGLNGGYQLTLESPFEMRGVPGQVHVPFWMPGQRGGETVLEAGRDVKIPTNNGPMSGHYYPNPCQRRIETYQNESFAAISEMTSQNANLLAFANHLPPNSLLPANIPIDIPRFLNNRYTFKTSPEYRRALDALLGNLHPEVAWHPITEHQSHSFWKEFVDSAVLVLAVMVAVTLGEEIPGLGFILTRVIQGTMAAMLDMAGQSVAELAGLQRRIEWSQVVTAALSAAMTTRPTSVLKVHAETSTKVFEEMMKQGTVNLGAQVTAMAEGKQTRLNFRSLLTTMVRTGINGYLDKGLGTIESMVANGVVNFSISAIAEGHLPNMESYAANWLGSMAGQTAFTLGYEVIDANTRANILPGKVKPGDQPQKSPKVQQRSRVLEGRAVGGASAQVAASKRQRIHSTTLFGHHHKNHVVLGKDKGKTNSANHSNPNKLPKPTRTNKPSYREASVVRQLGKQGAMHAERGRAVAKTRSMVRGPATSTSRKNSLQRNKRGNSVVNSSNAASRQTVSSALPSDLNRNLADTAAALTEGFAEASKHAADAYGQISKSASQRYRVASRATFFASSNRILSTNSSDAIRYAALEDQSRALLDKVETDLHYYRGLQAMTKGLTGLDVAARSLGITGIAYDIASAKTPLGMAKATYVNITSYAVSADFEEAAIAIAGAGDIASLGLLTPEALLLVALAPVIGGFIGREVAEASWDLGFGRR